MDLKIVISFKEMYWEFFYLVSFFLDVVRYTFWMVDFRGLLFIVNSIMINDMYLVFIKL